VILILKITARPNAPSDRCLPMDYHIWDTMLERCQKYTPMMINITELKFLLTIIEWFVARIDW